MKSQIFFVIPREEEKYKTVFKQGKIWLNKLWLKRLDFGAVFFHYLSLIKEQREKYQETLQINKDFLKKLVEELKKAIDGIGKKGKLESELRSKLVEKLREIKRLKEEIKKTQNKKPTETEKPEEKKKPKGEIKNEDTRKKLAELKELRKIIKEKISRFEEPEEDLLKKKKELEEILTEKLTELKKIERINELEEELRKLEEGYIDDANSYSILDNEIDPQKKV
ncbi:MAG: hypothetical protein NY202_03245 [Mollicutes bacterium UO1]